MAFALSSDSCHFTKLRLWNLTEKYHRENYVIWLFNTLRNFKASSTFNCLIEVIALLMSQSKMLWPFNLTSWKFSAHESPLSPTHWRARSAAGSRSTGPELPVRLSYCCLFRTDQSLKQDCLMPKLTNACYHLWTPLSLSRDYFCQSQVILTYRN